MTPGATSLGAPDPLLGATVGDRYRVVEKLGEGGMASVYRADVRGGGAVAIKVLHQHLASDASQRERFEREARALRAVEHPHILRVFDHGEVGGLPYMAMELLSGKRLDQLTEDGPLDPPLAFELGCQILSALAYAHEKGILHRDLKTENVFLQEEPGGRRSCRLLDFGLVKFTDDQKWGASKQLTAFGEVFGTPAYMAPEQFEGTPVDARADVYGMGVVLFELFTGSWPFLEEERIGMMKAHLMTAPPRMNDIRPELEFRPELEALVQRCLAKKKEDRFENAGALLAALRAVRQPVVQRSGESTARVPSVPPGGEAPANKPLVYALIAVAALVLLGAVAVAATFLFL